MRRIPWPGPFLPATLIALLLVTGAARSDPASAQGPSGPLSSRDLTVSVSISEVSALTGDTFTFTSEIANSGSDVTPPLIANLNIVSLDQDTYVDPEDWSPERTVNVAPIAAGSSANQSWTLNPVLKGEVAVYVVVLPGSPVLAAAHPVVASPAISVHVDERRALNPGGVLPVVIAVPGVLAVAFAGLRIARNRK